jgi:hypothetical protein
MIARCAYIQAGQATVSALSAEETEMLRNIGKRERGGLEENDEEAPRVMMMRKSRQRGRRTEGEDGSDMEQSPMSDWLSEQLRLREMSEREQRARGIRGTARGEAKCATRSRKGKEVSLRPTPPFSG